VAGKAELYSFGSPHHLLVGATMELLNGKLTILNFTVNGRRIPAEFMNTRKELKKRYPKAWHLAQSLPNNFFHWVFVRMLGLDGVYEELPW
jgi:hypothetical protein